MQEEAPTSPRDDTAFVGPDGRLSEYGKMMLEEMWRNMAPGFPIVPVTILNTTNVLTLTPSMHKEGAATYGDHMVWGGVMPSSTTAAVTAKVADTQGNSLATIKVYKTHGTVQAGNGDLISGGFYLFIYSAALDSGAGGFITK